MNYTDEQIIKALKHCAEDGDCDGCPYKPECFDESISFSIVAEDSFNLIQRLRAENERLEGKLKSQKAINTNLGLLYTQAKSEARKEFAERFEKEVGTIPVWSAVAIKKVKNLLEEMDGANG